jgi:hypothetical protein
MDDKVAHGKPRGEAPFQGHVHAPAKRPRPGKQPPAESAPDQDATRKSIVSAAQQLWPLTGNFLAKPV